MPSVKWDELFVFTVSPLELFIRGTIIYLLIFVLMRVFGESLARWESQTC